MRGLGANVRLHRKHQMHLLRRGQNRIYFGLFEHLTSQLLEERRLGEV